MGIAFGGSAEGVLPYYKELLPKKQKPRKYTFNVLLVVEPAEEGLAPEIIKERTCEFVITNEYPRLKQIHIIGIWEELIRQLDEKLKEFGVTIKWK